SPFVSTGKGDGGETLPRTPRGRVRFRNANSDFEKFECLVCLTPTVYHPLRVGDKLSFILIILVQWSGGGARLLLHPPEDGHAFPGGSRRPRPVESRRGGLGLLFRPDQEECESTRLTTGPHRARADGRVPDEASSPSRGHGGSIRDGAPATGPCRGGWA